MTDLAKITGFDWDEGHARKNEKDAVSAGDAEQVFFNKPLLFLADPKHSGSETRFHALGKTGTAASCAQRSPCARTARRSA
jgi:uncharacterized DUF497 family protein